MVNPDELAICRRRGHSHTLMADEGWRQCKWCGLWHRQILTIEEREDDPPKAEQSIWNKVR